jgi:hypothetical protein
MLMIKRMGRVNSNGRSQRKSIEEDLVKAK